MVLVAIAVDTIWLRPLFALRCRTGLNDDVVGHRYVASSCNRAAYPLLPALAALR